RLGLGDADRVPARTARWRRADIVLPPQAMGGSGRAAAAAHHFGRSGEGQAAMAEAVTPVFAPKRAKDAPNMLLAEAGTGIGKTLAYLAPASLWADESSGTVWVSTFTKALQRQLDGEGPKLFADPEERKRKIVIRK